MNPFDELRALRDELRADLPERPAQCRFRLIEEGKPYGRSGCKACGGSVVSGFHACSGATPPGRATELAIADRLDAILSSVDVVDAGEHETVLKKTGPNGWTYPVLPEIAGVRSGTYRVFAIREKGE